MMNNPAKFIEEVQAFDGSSIEQSILDNLAPLLALEHFNFEVMKGKSTAAAYLCSWIVNIVKFNTIYKKVKPLKDAADAAEALANEKLAELAVVLEKVRLINVSYVGLLLKKTLDFKAKVLLPQRT
jgi:dynein heavy chain